MRLSIDESHTYTKLKKELCRIAQVYLDGERIEGCVMADEEAGCVELFKLDENGRPFAEAGEIATEVKYGKVEIRGIDEWKTTL